MVLESSGGGKIAVRVTNEQHLVDAAVALQRGYSLAVGAIIGAGDSGPQESGGGPSAGALVLQLDGRLWRAGALFAKGPCG